MIASKIAFGMNSPFMKAYNRAIGITRTEGHRVQQESTLHCQQRAKWALSDEEYYTKYDCDKNELVRVEAKTYNDFKEKTKTHLMKIQFPDDVYKINGFTQKIKAVLETALLKLKSEYDIRLNSILVESSEKFEKGDIFVVGYHDGVMDMIVNPNADFSRVIKILKRNMKQGI